MESELTISTQISGIGSEHLMDRKDSVYQEIESCKTSYELRYVVAYEVAIRNSEVRDALSFCILENDCTKVKQKFGFTDEAIFYYRRTHLETFPLLPKVGGAPACLSGVDRAKYKYTIQPYILRPLSNKNDAIISNGVPIVRGKDKMIWRASIDDYRDFKDLSFEARFIRPKLLPWKRKSFYVDLNFELPESEIVEYIQYLRKMFYKEKIQSPIELLSGIPEFTSSGEIKANAKKYADKLYVYDYATLHIDKFETDKKLHEKIALDLAYSNSGEEILASNTIRNYREEMTKIVEGFGYLEFLTGIRQ